MSKPTCPKCKVEAVEVHMLLSSFMGCPQCKEDVSRVKLDSTPWSEDQHSAELPNIIVPGDLVWLDNSQLMPRPGARIPLAGAPSVSDYEAFLAKKLKAYVSWNVFTEEFDILYAGGQGTSYTYEVVKNMYDLDKGAKK